MLPFDKYPGGGRQLLGLEKGSNCRHEYGAAFMQLTGERVCAYCDTDLTKTYEACLSIVLDHVVPASVCVSSLIPTEWCEDFSNRVLACATCNGFCNRNKLPVKIVRPEVLESFFDLRDRIFDERKKLIAERHERERRFFEERHWERKGVAHQ